MQENEHSLSEIDLVFQTLDDKDPCVPISKQYLSLESETTYKCSLCNVTIPRPNDSYERRFGIWLHIHDLSHKSQLPNYSTMLEYIQKVLKELSSKEPQLKNLNCFEIGPVYYLIVCRICQCVVRCNIIRIKEHITDITHSENSQTALEGCKEVNTLDLKIDSEFSGLIKTLPKELKEEEKYLKKGHAPGYVICSLCSNCVLSTTYYLSSHLNDFWHQNNKINVFSLPDYSRKLPNPVKPMSKHILPVSGMEFVITVMKSNDSVIKNNIKYICKRYGKNIYYCQPCSKKFIPGDSSSLFELVALHFKEKIHIKNKNSPLRLKLKEGCFSLFENIPEEAYQDVGFFKVVSSKEEGSFCYGEVVCSACMISLPLDLTVFIDHIQSKQHVKKKISFNESHLSKKLDSLSIIDEVFETLSNADDNIKSVRQNFILNDRSEIICKLCNLTVGHTTNTMIDLQNVLLKHIGDGNHTVCFQKASCSSSNVVDKAMLKNMFKTISNLDKVNKNVIVISKKPGHLKCTVCNNSRFYADIDSLKDHIKQKNHKKHIEQWKKQMLNKQ